MANEDGKGDSLAKALLVGVLIFLGVLGALAVGVGLFGEDEQLDHLYEGFD